MYQGYENYPTFTVALWFDNNRERTRLVEFMVEWFTDTEKEYADVRMAEWLEGQTRSYIPDDLGDNVAGSMISHALTEVDWIGLARKYLKGDD